MRHDETYRAQLDSFFDLLDDHSLFELSQIFLVRFNRKVQIVFKRPIRSYVVVGVISFILNNIVFVVTANHVIVIYNSFFNIVGWSMKDLLREIEKAGWPYFLGLTLLIGLLGMTFDLLSLAITLTLLRWASRAKNLLVLSVHIGIDIIVAIASCTWSYIIIDFIIRAFHNRLLPIFKAHSGLKYLKETLWATFDVAPEMWYVVILLGISASLPTILYLVVLVPIMFLRTLPQIIQKGLSRVVFLITTDKRPVLVQLATFISSLTALLGAIIAWIKLVQA